MLGRKARGHLVTLIKIGVHLITCFSGHIASIFFGSPLCLGYKFDVMSCLNKDSTESPINLMTRLTIKTPSLKQNCDVLAFKGFGRVKKKKNMFR